MQRDKLFGTLLVFLAGWLVVWCLPHLIAWIFALPGLRAVINGNTREWSSN